MKKAQDRASIIEEALWSFEWLSRVGVWLAFSLAGISFLFWAGLDVSKSVLLSYLFLSFATLPARVKAPTLQVLRNFIAMSAVLVHTLALYDEYGSIPSVLLIVPAFLFAELISGWIWKTAFTLALWAIHSYWSFGAEAANTEWQASTLGFVVTILLVFVFDGFQNYGKKLAALKLAKLKGQNDFKGQRVHASRLQILGELTASLVHELSNPVTNLQGFFSQLSQSEEVRLNIHNREISNRIDANLNRIRDLLLGFRSFSRLQPTEKSTFRSSELFKDLELLSRHAFQSQKVELKIQADLEDIEISGNRVEIGQVLMNFLLNALASAKNSEEKFVTAGIEKRASSVVFYVEDSGSGVPEELKEKIFRPFFSTKGDEGSGLGLYISKIIAEHHECKIQVQTAKIYAHGARFELEFPEERIIPSSKVDRVA